MSNNEQSTNPKTPAEVVMTDAQEIEIDRLTDQGFNYLEARTRAGVEVVDHEVLLSPLEQQGQIIADAIVDAPKPTNKPRMCTWRDKAQADRYSGPDGTKFKY